MTTLGATGSSVDDRLVTAVEVRSRFARWLRRQGQCGLLRLEGGSLAFERTDGRRVFEKPLEQLTGLRRHRRGHGFWLSLEGRKVFLAPLARPRRKRPPLQIHSPVWYVKFLLYVVGLLLDRRRNRRVPLDWLERLPGGTSAPWGGLALRWMIMTSVPIVAVVIVASVVIVLQSGPS